MRRHQARSSRRLAAPHSGLAQLLALFALLAVFACDRVTPVAPVGSTITLSINPTRIAAQGESAVVTAIVRKEDGTPVNPGTQVNFSTSLGTLDPEVAFTDETGVARANLTGDGRIGMAMVSATTGAAALISVEVQVGSLAASITLTASKTDISKSPPPEGDEIRLLALVRDDTGAPLGGVTVNFQTGTGSLGSGGAAIVTNELGEARDTLLITRNNLLVLAEPFFQVFAQTAIEGGSLIEDFVDIFISDVPVTLSFQPTPTSVFETGGAIDLAAQVGDNLGEPLPGVLVSFFTAVGQLEFGVPRETNASGRAEDRLTATASQLAALGSTNFEVRAEAAGFGGNVLVESFTIQVVSVFTPVASFTAVPRPAPDNLIVDFTFTGSCACTLGFAWDFNGEATSTERNPTHPFATNGLKTITLVVTNLDAPDPKPTATATTTLNL